jgi:DNA-binding winged helix-turn-helix (wHTH) protein
MTVASRAAGAAGPPLTFRFGEFELDERAFELRRGGVVLAVQRKVLELIHFLVRHRDCLVTREALCAEVWRANTVTDAAIAQTLKSARAVLADDANNSRLIRTVRGKGIRFVGQVVEVRGSTEAAVDPAVVAHVGETRRLPLVGRRRELERLRSILEETQRGAGRALVVTGAAGVGKSALCEALACEATRRGTRVFWGDAWEPERAPPLWVWLDLLRSIAESSDVRALGSPPAWATQWTGLVPGLVQTTLDAARASDNVDLRCAAQHSVVHLFDSIVRFICWTAESVPLLLVLENLHRADDDSISLLRFVASRVRSSRTLLVATLRHSDRDQRDQRADWLYDLRDTDRIDLSPLSRDETYELVAAMDSDHSRRATLLYELSDGNPRAVRQLCARFSNPQCEPDEPPTTIPVDWSGRRAGGLRIAPRGHVPEGHLGHAPARVRGRPARTAPSAVPAIAALATQGFRDAHEAAQAIFGLIHKLLGLRICVLTRIDLEANTLTVLEAYDGAGLGVASGLSLPADTMPCACVVRNSAALREFDLDAHPAFRCLPARTKLGLRAYIGVPLRRSDGTIWGTLAATDTIALELTERHVDALTVLARLAALEFERDEQRRASIRTAPPTQASAPPAGVAQRPSGMSGT